MSDYLWDKTGEPEEDVKRLEELLGQLRFQPRTFEVPATMPVVPRRASRAAGNFSWPRLAVAASLVLTLLAGAWLVFTRQKTTSTPSQAAHSAAPEENTAVKESIPSQYSIPPILAHEFAPTVPQHSHRPRREEVSDSKLKRPAAPQRQSTVFELNAPREQVANNSQADATALTPQERDAMEKFVLAMRVTSEKLNYAERQVQSMSDSSPRR